MCEMVKPLEFKQDFDFRPLREVRDHEKRRFANIAKAQPQQDGAPHWRLIAVRVAAADESPPDACEPAPKPFGVIAPATLSGGSLLCCMAAMTSEGLHAFGHWNAARPVYLTKTYPPPSKLTFRVIRSIRLVNNSLIV